MKRAAESLTPVILELGGKDCAIISEDVNLNTVIPILMRGVFQNCGQNCIGKDFFFCFLPYYFYFGFIFHPRSSKRLLFFNNEIVRIFQPGLERLILEESIHDQFIEIIRPQIESLKVGPPLGDKQVDCGAITMAGHVREN